MQKSLKKTCFLIFKYLKCFSFKEKKNMAITSLEDLCIYSANIESWENLTYLHIYEEKIITLIDNSLEKKLIPEGKKIGSYKQVFNERKQFLEKYFQCPDTLDIFNRRFIERNIEQLNLDDFKNISLEASELGYIDIVTIAFDSNKIKNIQGNNYFLWKIYSNAEVNDFTKLIRSIGKTQRFIKIASTAEYYTYFNGIGAFAWDRKFTQTHAAIRAQAYYTS